MRRRPPRPGAPARALLLLGAAACAACATPGAPRPVRPAPAAPRTAAMRIPAGALTPKASPLAPADGGFLRDGDFTVLGWSIEGRPLRCLVLGDGPERVVMVAAVHGDEGAGAPLLRLLARHLEANPALLEGREVVLVPIANPDGLAHGARLNARGRDINRNFPTANWQEGRRRGPRALSEPETRALHRVLTDRPPARVVTIHQPLGGVNYDGPARDLARRMARATGLRLLEMRERRGSIGAFLGTDLGVPVVTLELPQEAGDMHTGKLWRLYGEGLLWAVTWPHDPDDGRDQAGLAEDGSATVPGPADGGQDLPSRFRY